MLASLLLAPPSPSSWLLSHSEVTSASAVACAGGDGTGADVALAVDSGEAAALLSRDAVMGMVKDRA